MLTLIANTFVYVSDAAETIGGVAQLFLVRSFVRIDKLVHELQQISPELTHLRGVVKRHDQVPVP